MRIPHNEPLGSDSLEASERRCILTANKGSRDELIRLAISPAKPDGSCDVMPDALARAPGRGAWIGVNRAALEEALGSGKLKGALARAFKGAPLTIPADLAQRTEDALRRAFLDRLGLEMRAGKLILGTDRIADHARGGSISWLAHAADAGEDGSKKLDQALRVGMDAEGSGLTGERLPLDRAALSVALGRDNVVHLALADRGSAERVAIPLGRLVRFLGANPAADTASGETENNAARAATTN
ncbi:MAG: DUF448 domain-containing protein [Candidatus Andeanibacterium colombiense]|uniref:DUF448 domain-containing protein n=1 Tax=Candidatus Andeanibacterium colombiense TaxID=3121345 RepID=A0AAJ5X5B8_9SPHN|nr:MAG: DUF448 domain-containing protein [Sphingomonadaceae bacterium]